MSSDYTCRFCDEELDDDNDEVHYHIRKCTFIPAGHGQVNVVDVKHGHACEGCSESNTFYCYFTGEQYYDGTFSAGDDKDGNTICIQAVEAAGYIATSDGEWILPAEPNLKGNNVSKSEYVDFYWQLKDGERHGVLQKDGGDEVDMPKSLEKKIYHRIDEAGADNGDPNVVNTYTRLELIEQGILPEDYVL